MFLLVFVLFLPYCSNKTDDNINTIFPLEAPYQYFDQLNQDEARFEILNKRLNNARAQNNSDEIIAATKDFETTQNECIKKLESKFPSGSIQLPFEQFGGKDSIIVKSVYVSGFTFPWNTASSISYYFEVQYEIQNQAAVFIPILMKFSDSEADIIYLCSVPANSSGKTQFLVRAQPSFRKFTEIFINQ